MKLRPAVTTAVIAAICGCSFASEPVASRLLVDAYVGFSAPPSIDSAPGLPAQRPSAPFGSWMLDAPAASLDIDAYLATPDAGDDAEATPARSDAGPVRPVIVPEPSTFALMLAGVSVVVFLGARRRRN